jgi:hypothetical protein
MQEGKPPENKEDMGGKNINSEMAGRIIVSLPRKLMMDQPPVKKDGTGRYAKLESARQERQGRKA